MEIWRQSNFMIWNLQFRSSALCEMAWNSSQDKGQVQNLRTCALSLFISGA